MSRRSTRILSVLESLGSTLPESKHNDVNDENKSNPPSLSKKARLEIKELVDKQVLVSLEKQVQEFEEHHAKQVKDNIEK